ncbi:hypothetical protein Zmor_014039 [Zophobas morio]|uniref:Protein takeout n=2 Tax=Zophobas morio TaxID=2755281 RepID=A0AA38IGA0_9CUCU|nr:hypothetical protein Zmor_014039 [Zophobas morio]
MKPFLQQGIPEFNIPTISPFFVPEVTIQHGSRGDSINYKVMLKNLQIFGFDTYKFDKFDFDVKNLQFQSSMKMDAMYLKGHYIADGKILSIPVSGNGTMSCNVTNTSGTLKQDGKIVLRKDNIKYLELEPPVIHINVGKILDYHYNGLFDGNEVLAKAAEKIFKDYQEELTEEVKPAIEKIIEEIVYDLQKKTTYKVPYDELYPIHG